MFDFLDIFTLVCGGEVKATPEEEDAATVPENDDVWAIKEHDKNNAAAEATTLQPVDPMDAKNYLFVYLSQPMGILLEENHDARHGGAFVAEINDGCSAAADGSICRGDQLIAIGDKRVSGMDFDEVIKLIFDNAETKVKLTFFRGPAESLYGPSGASIAWLDEFVAERGEEAALVEEESESEVTPAIIADVAVIPDLLDDVAVATTEVEDACALGDSVTADQRCVDAESCDDKHVDAALVVEDEVDMNEVVECVAEVENEVDTTDGAVFIKNDANSEAQVEAGIENEEDENDAYEQVLGEAEVENEVDGTDKPVVVEDEADLEEQVECEAAQETDAPILDGAVIKASKDWLDSYLANPESQLVSDDELDGDDTLDEPTEDLETRSKKAAELKEAALAAVVEKDNLTSAKGILKEPRYSPKGVNELKQIDPSHVDSKKSSDDESAASSVWSEADDYVGQVVAEVPVKRVGSSLAAMGVASTLATNMTLT